MERDNAYDGPVTLDRIEELPDIGARVELMAGEARLTLVQGAGHADAVSRLLTRIDPECEWRRLSLRARTNRGVYFAASEEMIVPDLVVYRAEGRTLRGVYLDPADVVLVVEVASLATRRRDRFEKPALCARYGIGLYLLVDPFPMPVTVTLFAMNGEGSTYERVTEVTAGEPLWLPAPFGFELDTSGL
jgi:Uma2 family endonuclease